MWWQYVPALSCICIYALGSLSRNFMRACSVQCEDQMYQALPACLSLPLQALPVGVHSVCVVALDAVEVLNPLHQRLDA